MNFKKDIDWKRYHALRFRLENGERLSVEDWKFFSWVRFIMRIHDRNHPTYKTLRSVRQEFPGHLGS